MSRCRLQLSFIWEFAEVTARVDTILSLVALKCSAPGVYSLFALNPPRIFRVGTYSTTRLLGFRVRATPAQPWPATNSHLRARVLCAWSTQYAPQVSEMMSFLRGNTTLLTDLIGATPPRVMATRHIFCVAETSGNIQPPVMNVGLLVSGCPSKYWSYTSFASTTLECKNDNFVTLEAATSLLCGLMNIYLRELSLALGEDSHR
ncbi:hypothetical protein EDB83DRAFT_1035046 [Lactarius deliciosus]|nr:hypothetical protein EDB83DRAFT_1035046 [Lactarius deliciosus]